MPLYVLCITKGMPCPISFVSLGAVLSARSKRSSSVRACERRRRPAAEVSRTVVD